MEKCLQGIRQIANDLRPSALGHLRLTAAIEEHARYFAELSRLHITVTEVTALPPVDEPTRLLFFRAAQEMLTNVVRHAQASHVDIVLKAADGWIVMEVADDGIGIDEQMPFKVGSLGLLGHSRAGRRPRGRVVGQEGRGRGDPRHRAGSAARAQRPPAADGAQTADRRRTLSRLIGGTIPFPGPPAGSGVAPTVGLPPCPSLFPDGVE